MKIDWSIVISVLVALVIIVILYHMTTKRKVDAETGLVKTKFLGFDGFEGDKKDNYDPEG